MPPSLLLLLSSCAQSLRRFVFALQIPPALLPPAHTHRPAHSDPVQLVVSYLQHVSRGSSVRRRRPLGGDPADLVSGVMDFASGRSLPVAHPSPFPLPCPSPLSSPSFRRGSGSSRQSSAGGPEVRPVRRPPDRHRPPLQPPDHARTIHRRRQRAHTGRRHKGGPAGDTPAPAGSRGRTKRQRSRTEWRRHEEVGCARTRSLSFWPLSRVQFFPSFSLPPSPALVVRLRNLSTRPPTPTTTPWSARRTSSSRPRSGGWPPRPRRQRRRASERRGRARESGRVAYRMAVVQMFTHKP